MKPLLLTAALFAAGFATAQTPINQDIYQTVALTSMHSPYILQKDIVVHQGAELTVIKGTEIQFNGHTITLKGSLLAEGTDQDSIRFTGQGQGGTAFIVQENDKVYSTQVKLKKAAATGFDHFIKVDKTNYGMKGAFIFEHCNFSNNTNVMVDRPVFLDDVLFDNCVFYNNKLCIKGEMDSQYELKITNSDFINNEKGVIGGEIDNCFFTGHSAFAVHYRILKNSVIYNNNVGAEGIADTSTLAENNEFSYNKVGLELEWQDEPGTKNIFFNNNKVCHNTEWNIKYLDAADGTIYNTCWCSSDSLTIRNKIFDARTDNQYGKAYFSDIQTCSITMTDPAGIKDRHLEHMDIRLYPNPASGNTTLSFTPQGTHSYFVTVRDMTGRTVMHPAEVLNGKATINTSGMTAGIYFVQLHNEAGMATTAKLVIR